VRSAAFGGFGIRLGSLFPALGVAAVALGAVFAGVGARAEDSAPRPTIADVRFEGLETLKAEDLMGQIQSRPGTPYDPRRVREDLKRLAKLARDAEVRRERTGDGPRLIFILRENPTLGGVQFVGNSAIKTERLEKIARLRPGDVLTRDAVGKARDAVLREYRVQGFPRTQVRADLARTADGKEFLQVSINEGRRLKIEDLVIHGNRHFSTLRIKTALETKGSWTFLKNYFDEEAFQDDLDTIRRLYQSAGFFDVEVARGPSQYDEKRPSVTPSIVITEGLRYSLGDVTTHGNTFFTREEIQAPFAGYQGEHFDAKAYAAALRKTQDLYNNTGFVTTEITDRLDFDREKGLVNVTVEVDEKPRTKVGRIQVQRRDLLTDEDQSWFGRIYNGVAPPVANDVILREVALKPGEVYDKRKEEESAERLRRLDIFEEVEVSSRSTDDPGVRDMVVRVEEGVTGNIFLGLGYSESFGAYVFSRYTERNFLGQAGDLRLDVMAGTREVNASISYLDRYLGSSDRSLYSEIHHLAARRPGYDEKNTGLQVELGVPLEEEWKAFFRTRLEYVQLDENGHDPEEDFNRDYPVATLGLRFVHDTRTREKLLGNTYWVTGGHVGSAGLEGGYADGPLAKLTGSYEWYRKIGEKLVFTTDLRAGLMPVDADRVGPTERFYMGGGNDLRGFKYRRAGPHDRGDNDVPLGGATKLLARNELHYPLLDSLTGLVFVDAGSMDDDAFSLSTPRASAGLGFRLALQGVQVGIDFAAPLASGRHDDTRYFHFRMNTLRGF
jgi:outer membrane protein insertion porin family